MGALVINADKFPGGAAYLTDAMITDTVLHKARKLGHDHVVCRIGGKNVPFRYLGESHMELSVAGPGEYHSGRSHQGNGA